MTKRKKGKSKYHVTNADLLAAIHRCKLNWCEIFDKDCVDYDLIVENKKDIFTESAIEEAKNNRAQRLGKNPEDIRFYDLVFRVMTYEHIPVRKKPKNVIKTVADEHVPLNFKPFKHYVIEDFDHRQIKEVLRSHSKNLKYSKKHGRTTEELGRLYTTLVEEYAKKPNWAGYSYIDEMRENAKLQLVAMGLKFDESKSNNPFAYMTTTIYRSFINTLKKEKAVASVREEMLQSMGYDETFSAQADHDIERYEKRMERESDEDE